MPTRLRSAMRSLSLVSLVDAGAVDGDAAALRLHERVDAAQDGRFARAGGADDGDRIALADGQVDALQHLCLAEGQMHVFQSDNRGVGGCVHRLNFLRPR